MNHFYWVKFRALEVGEFCEYFGLSTQECQDYYLRWSNEYERLTKKFYYEQNKRRLYFESNKFSDNGEYSNDLENDWREGWRDVKQRSTFRQYPHLEESLQTSISHKSSGCEHISSLLSSALDFDYGLSPKIFTLENAKALWFNTNIARPSEIELNRLKSLEYKYYLNTDHWQKVRAAMILLSEARCKLCSDQNWDRFLCYYASDNQKRLHIHHLHYKNIGHERYEDLTLLCHEHHEKEHSNQS
jgi:hypothetical protein